MLDQGARSLVLDRQKRQRLRERVLTRQPLIAVIFEFNSCSQVASY